MFALYIPQKLYRKTIIKSFRLIESRISRDSTDLDMDQYYKFPLSS